VTKYSTYTDLDVWIKSRLLTNWIYSLTKGFPKEEMYGLTSQMRRCAVSVPSNIAEGSGRGSSKDSIQFFRIARGSLFEMETQLYIAKDQNYITAKELEQSLVQVVDCKKLINGYINYYKKLNVGRLDNDENTNNDKGE
jgi:four helix bundle protein